jgi:hypothetical protein
VSPQSRHGPHECACVRLVGVSGSTPGRGGSQRTRVLEKLSTSPASFSIRDPKTVYLLVSSQITGVKGVFIEKLRSF